MESNYTVRLGGVMESPLSEAGINFAMAVKKRETTKESPSEIALSIAASLLSIAQSLDKLVQHQLDRVQR